MACIGAQTVVQAVRSTPATPGVETPCRREGGSLVARTYFCLQQVGADNGLPVQLALFEIRDV